MIANDHLISEEDFDAIWRVTVSPSGDLFCYEEVIDQPLNHVWTIVESGDGEDGNWYASPGFHTVNRVGYAVTKKSWDLTTPDAIYFLDDMDC